MERADFVHLVRLSEQASEQDSNAYRRSVAAFAALGYGWVVACLVLGAGLVLWSAGSIARGQFKGFSVWMLLGGAGLLWTSAKALWCRLDAPGGEPLSAKDAPALFEALERIRKKVKGPPIHQVYLDAEFNASISQRPRYGLFGGAVNSLTVGLPLLMAIDRQRLLAVLAHEYGHLRGGHGTFAAWVYRTRLSWAKLHHGMRGDDGVVAAATQAFLRWYFPRFSARTFALARQDEYEADRIAGRLLGKEVAAAALTEIAIKSEWLHQEFWPGHWAGAASNALPQGPFGAMKTLLAMAPPEDFARESLRQALRRISDLEDTHPVLRDRLDSLGAGKGLPAWSARPALELLGASGARWVAHFDRQWCRENASGWKQHHAYLSRVGARADSLMASAGRNGAAEMVELADLLRRIDPKADVQAHYEKALAITPDHPGALRGLAQTLPAAQQARRMDCLARLFGTSVAHQWWASRVAVAELERAHPVELDEAQLKLWRERARQAGEAESRAWEELTQTSCFEAISRHDLNEFELGEVRADLARCRPVVRAWLVRKNLREFPWRRCYVLFVELPGLHDEDRYDLCRELEHSLDLPGPVLCLWAGTDPTLEQIQAKAFQPVLVPAAA